MKPFKNSVQIYVKSFSLAVIIRRDSGHLDVVQLLKSGQKNILLDSAYLYLNENWKQYQEKHSNQIMIPVFCLHAPSPLVGTVESLLMQNLPDLIEKQLIALKLVRPFNVTTKIAGFEHTYIGHTIVDITSSGIVILGNVNDIIEYMRIYGSRYFHPFNTTKEIADNLEETLKNSRKSLFGFQSMVGGLAAILIVEYGFLINNLISSEIILKDGYLVGIVLSIVCFTQFLFERAFCFRLFAFSFPWAIRFQFISLVLFLSFIMFLPITLIFPFSSKVFWFVWLITLLITSLGFTSNIGRIFHQGKYAKMSNLFLWSVVMLGLLCILVIGV